MNLENLTWYIMPYNMGDFRIVGADPNDTRRELEDGGDFYIYGAKVYVVLADLSKRMGIRASADVLERPYYETYLEPYKFYGYTWKNIRPIAIDLIFKWFENGRELRPEKFYKVK